jgi:hypothetical protein
MLQIVQYLGIILTHALKKLLVNPWEGHDIIFQAVDASHFHFIATKLY